MPTFEEWKKENPGASDELIRRQMAIDAGGSSSAKSAEPTAPGIFARARGAVASGINAVNSLGGTIPQSVVDIGNRSSMIPAESLNPVPDTAGGAAALAASLAANRLTGGAPGVGPAAARMLAPVAAGAVPDTMLEQDPIQNALWRTLWGGGSEAVAGATGVIRKMMGASRLQQGDVANTAEAVSTPSRQVEPNVKDLREAGASKPKAGNPAASGSLEAAAKEQLNKADSVASQLAGSKIDFDIPGLGPQTSLKDALGHYRALAEGRMTTASGDQLIQAEKLWTQIVSRLQGSGLPELKAAGQVLVNSRGQFAQDMAKQRIVGDLTTGSTEGGKSLAPGVDPKSGALQMNAMQQRYLQLKDAGMIPAEMQPALEAKLFRGGQQPGQPLTDQPGEFKIGSWVRLGHGGVPTVGMHPESFLKAQLPQFVGTPENLAPVQPIQGLQRQLMSLGALATGEEFKRRLKSAP